MDNQFKLFTKQRFLAMFCTQFSGAFNDNLFKQALILMLTYEGAKQLGISISLSNNLVALLFILPFFLLSSTAGQLADKYEKSQLTQKVKTLEIAIAVIAAIGFIGKIYVLLFLALFLLGVQSTLFGPIKYAFLPQALKENELISGNSLFQMGTSVAIISAMIVASALIKMGDGATIWLSLGVVCIAIFGYMASRKIPETLPPRPHLKINWNIFATSYSTIAFIKPLKSLMYCLIAISWYWFFGAVFIMQIPEMTKSILLGDASVVIFVLTLFTIGIAFGSVFCKTITKGEVTLKLVPFSLVGISLMTFDLYWSLSQVTVGTHIVNLQTVLQNPDNYRIFFDFSLLGVFGGLYIVPLYAMMQIYAPKDRRAEVIAGNNIINAFFMVLAAIFSIAILTWLKLSLPILFALTGCINIMLGLFVWKKMRDNLDTLERQV